MKAAIKWTAIVVTALVVAVIGALLILPKFIDVNQFKPELEKYVLEATGRPLTIGGEVGLSLFPWAGVSFSDLRLGNVSAFAEKDFLTVKSFDVQVKLWPLLSRQIEVDRLLVVEPRISMVTNKDGRINWDFSAKPADAKPPAKNEAASVTELPISSLLVGELSIQNGQITLIDHGKGSRQDISDLNLALRDLSFDRPVRLSFTAAINQKRISAEGRFGPVGKNLGEGAVPLDLKADAFAELKLNIKGTVRNLIVAPLADVAVEVMEFSPRKLLAAIGQAPPATADAKVLDRVSFRAGIQADGKAVSISEALLALDDSKLNFNAKVSEFAKPQIGFDLSVDQINLDRYLPPTPDAGAGPPPAGRFSETLPKKTDYTGLRQLVMNGNAKIGKLVISNAKVEDVNLKIAARDGILALDPFSMRLYQGTAVGKTAVDVKGESPLTKVQLDLDKVQINPLLRDMANKDFLEGSAKAQVALSMAGDEPARIKQTLDGKGSLILSDGAIVGVDLANMVRNVKTALGGEAKTGAKPRTDFAELIVPFTIENGVFHTPETSLKSPLLRLQAAGNANLVKETLDFRADPKIVGTIKGQGDERERSGLGVPVIVSGTFSSPRFRPDLEGLAKDNLKQMVDPSATGAAPVKEKAGELIKGLLPRKK